MVFTLFLADKRNAVISALIIALAFFYFDKSSFYKYNLKYNEASEHSEDEERKLKKYQKIIFLFNFVKKIKIRKMRSENETRWFRQIADHHFDEQSWKREHVVAAAYRVRDWLLLRLSLQRTYNVQKWLYRWAWASNKWQDGCREKSLKFELRKRGRNRDGNSQPVRFFQSWF